ncbi:MAG: archease [Elusimicrobia bacterium]|nr:archease [Elusimicrobiota bacterium]
MRNKHKAINDASCLETVIFGKNLKNLFENAAFKMYSLIAKPDSEKKKKPIKITVTANNTESLLMAYLKELMHYYLVRKILLCSVNVMSLTKNKVHAKLTGEELGRRHNIINDIKSVKYGAATGAVKIVKTRTGYKTEIIFDVNVA